LRVLVFLLVLANLLFFVFAGGYIQRADNPDAGRFAQQLAAERVRIVGHGLTPPARGAAEPRPVETEPAPVPPELCLLWGPLQASDADQLASTLAEKLAGVRVERRAVPSERNGWWVMVPPLASKADADKKADELKDLGVKDLFIVHDAGPSQFAISLGVFSSEKGGQGRLSELKAKGVKSARLVPRPGKESQFTIEARGPVANKADIEEIATGIVPKLAAQDCK
jgi:SPOR domain